MNKDTITDQKLEELVNTWSSVFYSKVEGLFTMEELIQEIWVKLLEVRQHIYNSEKEIESIENYFYMSIYKHLTTKALRELKNRIFLFPTEGDLVDNVNPLPEEEIIALDIIDNLYRALLESNINKHGNSSIENIAPILKGLIEGKTLKELGDEIGVTKNNMFCIRSKIRDEFKKLEEGEFV